MKKAHELEHISPRCFSASSCGSYTQTDIVASKFISLFVLRYIVMPNAHIMPVIPYPFFYTRSILHQSYIQTVTNVGLLFERHLQAQHLLPRPTAWRSSSPPLPPPP
jgi:hypothetical protein